jgi:3-hydroxyacyl-[acyl-carrier-protein] dehydratase
MTVTGPPPFAAPLLAVDEVRVGTEDTDIVVRATKTIVATDPYLDGHFPGLPVYPGVFLVESLRQAVVAAIGEADGNQLDLSRLASARFLSVLVPGDQLSLHATVRCRPGEDTFDVAAKCFRGDDLVATITAEFQKGNPDA